MHSCFAIIYASLICFAKQQHTGFLVLWCKPSNSLFRWQSTFQFRAMKDIHIFQCLIWFSQLMMLLKEAVNALLSGDGSFGAQGHDFIREAFIWASDDVTSLQKHYVHRQKVFISASQKESPRCCNKC